MDLINISQTALMMIIGTIGLALFGILFGLVYKGIDRKLAAHMQGRIGPPIRQPFLDVAKLFTKENIVPENAVPWVFNLAPLVGLVAAISILLYMPLGGFAPLLSNMGDLILILYLLIIPSLAMVIGGFASGSPYATVGAQREMTTMIAYEFPLAIIIISIAWKLSLDGVTNVFALSSIASAPVWNTAGPIGFIGFMILLLALIIVTPAELSKIPFDSPEAESEIAGGLLVEYSGRNLAMFYLVKVFLVILFSVTLIRVAIARLKIDQIVYTYWVPLTLLSLVGLICIMWDQTIMANFGLQPVFEMLGLI